jgi:hypothetical protein
LGRARPTSILSSPVNQPAIANSDAPNQSPSTGEQIPALAAAQSPSPELSAPSALADPGHLSQTEAQRGSPSAEGLAGTFSADVNNEGKDAGPAATTAKADVPRRGSGAAPAASSTQAVAQKIHASQNRPALQAAPSFTQPQVSGQSGDPSSLVRNPDLLSGEQNSTEARSGSRAASDASAASETFAAIDNAARDASSWTHLGPHRAEAGIQDPTLGWIGVRADGSAGQVHATLMPGSGDAAEALSGHMAGLNTYLADAHISLQSLHIAQPEGRNAASNASQDQSQGLGQGSNQSMSQNPGQENAQAPSRAFAPGESSTAASVRAAEPVSTENFSRPASLTELSGGHISVMA